MLAAGSTLLVAPERGYAVVLGGAVRLLASFDVEGASELLRAALARAVRNAGAVHVEWLTARQQWAIDVCVEAGLELAATGGPLFTGGDVGPFQPYLPNGAYL
jgi:hypothetical protein